MTEYRLDVTVAPDLSEITGQADIRYTNREAAPLDTIYLHLYPNLWDGGMTVTEAQVNGAPVDATYPSGDDVIGLPLAAPLAPGESVELALHFSSAGAERRRCGQLRRVCAAGWRAGAGALLSDGGGL